MAEFQDFGLPTIAPINETVGLASNEFASTFVRRPDVFRRVIRKLLPTFQTNKIARDGNLLFTYRLSKKDLALQHPELAADFQNHLSVDIKCVSFIFEPCNSAAETNSGWACQYIQGGQRRAVDAADALIKPYQWTQNKKVILAKHGGSFEIKGDALRLPEKYNNCISDDEILGELAMYLHGTPSGDIMSAALGAVVLDLEFIYRLPPQSNIFRFVENVKIFDTENSVIDIIYQNIGTIDAIATLEVSPIFDSEVIGFFELNDIINYHLIIAEKNEPERQQAIRGTFKEGKFIYSIKQSKHSITLVDQAIKITSCRVDDPIFVKSIFFNNQTYAGTLTYESDRPDLQLKPGQEQNNFMFQRKFMNFRTVSKIQEKFSNLNVI